jgi:type IV pilus assembly protein PilX
MKKWQKGIALVISLVLLTSMTVVGVSSVSSGVMQTKMATNQNTLSIAFDAADTAVEGIVYESSSTELRSGTVTDDDGNQLSDVLTEARNAGQVGADNQIDMSTVPSCDEIASATWPERGVSLSGLQDDSVLERGAVALSTNPEVWAWSKSAFLGLKNQTDASSGMVSSIVDTDGSRNRTILEVFVVKGCGHVTGSAVNVANTVIVSRQTTEAGD